MLCECCHKRLANVHYIKLVNNRQEEMHLCEQCAREKKQETAGSGFDLSDFFSGMIGYEVPSKDMGNVYRTVECPGCGMTDREFEKTGKAGCAACYGTFHKRMDTIIKRLHGSVRHTGKMPGTISKGIKAAKEVESLENQLKEAIKLEEYERAAKIRDDIAKAKKDKSKFDVEKEAGGGI